MGGIALMVILAGYSTLYYGYNTITGGNESFRSLIIPGKYAPEARDGAGSIANESAAQQAEAIGASLPQAPKPKASVSTLKTLGTNPTNATVGGNDAQGNPIG